MRGAPERFIAVDWSGDKTLASQRRKIWIADWSRGVLRLTNGCSRVEAANYLIDASRQTPRLAVGLDFAFSFPAWFVHEQGCADAEEFWRLVANGKGEEWLSQPNKSCWGRKGIRRPAGHRGPAWRGFRKTDRELNIAGIQPKSPFQIGGAGAVGTGSLRGIPVLHRLMQAGFSIWPFTSQHFPTVVEIYPRPFTGLGHKSSLDFRAAHLAQPQFAAIEEEILTKVRGSEDAFDALCSVLGMKDNGRKFALLERTTDPDSLLEGRIWHPSAYSVESSS